MNRHRLAGLIVVLLATNATAGVVSLVPSSVWMVLGERFTVDIIIESTELSSFDAIDIVVGNPSGGLIFDDFAFSANPAYVRFFEFSASDTEFYADGWKIGSFGTSQAAPLLVGTLSMTMAGIGEFEIVIDASIDGGRSTVSGGGASEPLTGSVWVSEVPEPGTLSLVGLAAIGLLHRRRATAPL